MANSQINPGLDANSIPAPKAKQSQIKEKNIHPHSNMTNTNRQYTIQTPNPNNAKNLYAIRPEPRVMKQSRHKTPEQNACNKNPKRGK